MKDFLIVSLIGFLAGWLVLPTAANFELKITPSLILFSVFGFTILAPLLLAVIYYLSRFLAESASVRKILRRGCFEYFSGF